GSRPPGRVVRCPPAAQKGASMTVSPDLDARFRDAAAAESLLDVAYELHDTPVGRLLIAVTDHGVCEIHYDADPEAEAERLARFFGRRVLRSARPTDEARRQLDEYFAGDRREFDLSVDLRAAREFGRAVLEELALVPYGELTTYGTLAAKAGRPRAALAVEKEELMRRVVPLIAAVLALTVAAPATAKGPTLKSLQAQITVLNKKVKKLQAAQKVDRNLAVLGIVYAGCSLAVTADALQGTWMTVDG